MSANNLRRVVGPPVLGAFALVSGGFGAGLPGPPPAAAGVRTHLLGRSVQGRAIRAYELGDAGATRKALVVGYVHGDERAGLAVVRELRRRVASIRGVDLWVVPTTNPDGGAADTRQNARGVDLNRNFPVDWRRLPRGTFYSGPAALSEPESKITAALLRRLKPAVSIWYHQHARLVDASGGDPGVLRRYAGLVGLPYRRFTRPPGSITTWTNRTFRGTTAFVVELPAGALSPASAARHARAVIDAARPPRSSAARLPAAVPLRHRGPHSDMGPAAMRRYRALLSRQPCG